MIGGRFVAAVLAAVVLASVGACAALAPANPAPSASGCASLTPAVVLRALREADSYTFVARGTIARYGAEVGAADHVEQLEVRGAYEGPDRLNEAYSGHGPVEELRIIGSEQWIRSHGSRRWAAVEHPALRPANELLAELEKINGWSEPDADADPGSCTILGSDSFALGEQTVVASVTVTTPLNSAMPREIALDFRYDAPAHREGALASRQVRYEIDATAAASIPAPQIDTSAATDEDVRYALRHLACGEPPCSIDNLRVTYAVHQPGLEMIGFEAGGRAGEAWFEAGLVRHVVQRGCTSPEFAWHEHDGFDAVTWLGGPMTLVPKATLRVTYSDDGIEEHSVSAPAYIVANRQHIDDGASIVSVELLGPDGEDLLVESRRAHVGHGAAC